MSSKTKISIESRWDVRPPQGGTAVVIDVLRFSTTVCALLTAGRRDILVADGPESLREVPDLKSADAFSELDFEFPGRHFDNSPQSALRFGRSNRKAYVTTTTGSKALIASRQCPRILIGGFANFNTVLEMLRGVSGAICFVPAAPPLRPAAIEDILCARAFAGALRGESGALREAFAALEDSPRIPQYFGLRLPTGREDFDYCLGVDSLPVVPEAIILGSSYEGEDSLASIHRLPQTAGGTRPKTRNLHEKNI